MIVVDSSALIAILEHESDAAIYAAVIRQAERLLVSAVNVHETGIVMRVRHGEPAVDTGGEFGDGRKSRGLRHFDSRLSVSLCESRRFLIDNFSFHLILQSMDGHVASNAPNRPGS